MGRKKVNLGIVFFLFLFFSIFSFFIWADSNGIFYNVEDVRPGVFGFDEQTNLSNFTFNVPLIIENNLTVNGNILVEGESLDLNRVATKFNVDNLYSKVNTCFSQGLLYNGSSCICPSGVEC